MDGSSLGWLAAFGGTVARIAIGLFVVINAAFIALVVMRRDRSLVDRWTKRLVVADAALLLAAGGVPAVTWGLQTATRVVAAVIPDAPSLQSKSATTPTVTP